MTVFRAVVAGFVGLCCMPPFSLAQSTNATVMGRVLDQTKAAVPGASIEVTNVYTNVTYKGIADNEGRFTIPDLPPGNYRVSVAKPGFKSLVKPDVVLHVQDVIALNFDLPLGSVAEVITVEAGTPLVNTESATVSTVVDRQFVENLPMNGRSFQTLIQLTPGVVLTPSTLYDSGQFSVNGQRASSNYWMVDGVSANIGVSSSALPGNGLAGSLGSFSAQGGTNSLVSVDALQEFRIQTSTYAPEFGRTPGGQISIVTRSGSNQFHGTLFDYLRNDILDANDWFANNKGLRKPEERQNDFGGTFGGPILKDRTFFFFAYEGLRLRLPQTVLSTVPSLSARQKAIPAVQPYLNAYPLPNGPEVGNDMAQFNASFSDSSGLNAYSLRIDHKWKDNLALFARYSYSPSDIIQHGAGSTQLPLNNPAPVNITTQTATVGATWSISPKTVNDLRFNYSRTNSSSSSFLNGFGGGVPLASLPFPSGFTTQNAGLAFNISALSRGQFDVGKFGHNLQRQLNIVDDVNLQRGLHSLKFGADYRRLSPLFDVVPYSQLTQFANVPSTETGSLSFIFLTSQRKTTLLFRNLGVFAQDTWRIVPRLTLTYGLRWDVDFAPTSIDGPSFPAALNFRNPSTLALAPAGTPPFNTAYGNVAPRIGIAYELSQSQDWETVLRGGFGVFFDLATQQAGSALSTSYPFGAFKFALGGKFPPDATTAAPPVITSAALTSNTLYAFDPHLQLPYTLQWNLALVQALGRQQVLSASYVGSAGRRLIQSAFIFSPNPSLGSAVLIGNSATSDYDALQLQFERRLSHGLQALASYTWSHSIDEASDGSIGNHSNTLLPSVSPSLNRGPSDFDIRNAFSAGLTYDIPTPRINAFGRLILGGWSIQNVIQSRSAAPLNLTDSKFPRIFGALVDVRPDLVSGVPVYLKGPQYPGGKALNPAAFTDPPSDPRTLAPLRQGNLGRNLIRGFGATQWDFAVHRDFPIHEGLKMQFRAEMFNILNHPNFGPPVSDINNKTQFGRSIQMLGKSLNGNNLGGGAFSPLYQIGGPRSVEFALKFLF